MKDRNVITPPLHKEAEFGELYKRYKARFESFAVGYVQDRLIAEDVVTDAFIYYWENRSRLDADCNAAAYILTTIRHKCLNYLRALQVRMRVHNGAHSAIKSKKMFFFPGNRAAGVLY